MKLTGHIVPILNHLCNKFHYYYKNSINSNFKLKKIIANGVIKGQDLKAT
jgi:hypothetical protein